jgi:arylsulfatase
MKTTDRRRLAAFILCAALMLPGLSPWAAPGLAAQTRPNIVLMFPDNLGWGEVGVYGGVRGPITPRIDKLASEGIRLNNFNVEFSCTVSRAALMTGRYAVRSGATQPGGITLWEVTLAEALKSVGYATGLFGKWHLGGDFPESKREPTHQGFDEFYGIPRTSNEAQTTIAQGQKTPGTSFIWEGRSGSPSRNVKPFDMETRRTVDRESAERGIAFMERSVKEKKAFFFYYPITQIHFPTLPHPAMSATRWRSSTRTSGACSTPSIGSASPATRSSSGAPTTAPSSVGRGVDHPDRGQGSTTA